MGRPKKNAGPKNPFADLDSDWREAVAGLDRTEIESRIAAVAIADSDLRKMKKEDMHLKECAETYKEAGEQYREGFKMNKLKIEFLKQALNDKGGPSKAVEDHVDTDADTSVN